MECGGLAAAFEVETTPTKTAPNYARALKQWLRFVFQAVKDRRRPLNLRLM
jgi:hypothetical protein